MLTKMYSFTMSWVIFCYLNLIMNSLLSTIGIVYNHCTMINFIHVHGFILKNVQKSSS